MEAWTPLFNNTDLDIHESSFIQLSTSCTTISHLSQQSSSWTVILRPIVSASQHKHSCNHEISETHQQSFSPSPLVYYQRIIIKYLTFEWIPQTPSIIVMLVINGHCFPPISRVSNFDCNETKTQQSNSFCEDQSRLSDVDIYYAWLKSPDRYEYQHIDKDEDVSLSLSCDSMDQS